MSVYLGKFLAFRPRNSPPYFVFNRERTREQVVGSHNKNLLGWCPQLGQSAFLNTVYDPYDFLSL